MLYWPFRLRRLDVAADRLTLGFVYLCSPGDRTGPNNWKIGALRDFISCILSPSDAPFVPSIQDHI